MSQDKKESIYHRFLNLLTTAINFSFRVPQVNFMSMVTSFINAIYIRLFGDKSKPEKTEAISIDKLNQLPDELLKEIGTTWLEPHDAQRIQTEARGHLLQLFDPIINEIAPGYAVLTAQPEKLLNYLKKDPALFFKKCHQIIGPGNITYYDASPADLILFLGDSDMQNQVHAWAIEHFPEGKKLSREEFFEQWKAHQASKGHGGADVVVVSGNKPPNYASICKVTNTFDVYGEIMTAERKLLANPNGVVCWRDANEQLHWYYADSKTKTLDPIEIPEALLAAHKEEYDAFISRIKNMEPNTAKRSSDKEHRLIKNLMQYTKTNERNTKTKVPVDLVRGGFVIDSKMGLSTETLITTPTVCLTLI